MMMGGGTDLGNKSVLLAAGLALTKPQVFVQKRKNFPSSIVLGHQ
jgi:hypothetical protein